jgi:hypothetical protein
MLWKNMSENIPTTGFGRIKDGNQLARKIIANLEQTAGKTRDQRKFINIIITAHEIWGHSNRMPAF